MPISLFISIFSIISFDIIRLIEIIDIIYLKSHQHSYVAHGARDRLYYPECICRHTMQLLQQKYQQSPVIFASLIWPTTPRNRGRVPYLTPAGTRRGRYRATFSAQSLTYRCTAGRSKAQGYRPNISDGSRP